MTTDHLKFSPDILKRLGEELIPQPEQGIVELVRNSYDADALSCTVELLDVHEPGGTVLIRDDGIGMDADSISSGWLVVGRSSKDARNPTALGRLPVGDKGLGRLAALRMGPTAELATRPKENAGVEYQVQIDWARVDEAQTVESVPIEILERKTSEPPGTTITMRDLHVRLGRREVHRLARSLLLLADPFDDATGFRIELRAPAFADLEKLVLESYFGEADHRLHAVLDQDGKGHAEVLDWKGQVLWEASHEDLADDLYEAPAASFDLHVFLLDSRSFSSRASSIGEVRKWLREVGGVHIYHRGLRVHPYGDQGHDWLEMNLRRVRSPEERPSTNNSIGRVIVEDSAERLVQKTDRSGFIENSSFGGLRAFCTDALEWMAKERLDAREKQRQRQRVQSSRSVVRAQENVDQALRKVPKKPRETVERAFVSLEKARDKETKVLKQEVQLYRTLATVGTTSAVFAHESAKPVRQIETMAKLARSEAKRLLPSSTIEQLEKPLSIIARSAEALRTFADLPLNLLRKEKRRMGRVDVNSVVTDVCGLFEPFLADAKISIELDMVDAKPAVMGSPAALEAIVANLLTNAVNAFALDGKTPTRQVIIRTEISGEHLLLRVMDNGSGIRDLSVKDIWLPGQTTVPGGTGLGLTIVRDSVVDLGGMVHALAQGELEGAEFVVELPLIGA